MKLMSYEKCVYAVIIASLQSWPLCRSVGSCQSVVRSEIKLRQRGVSKGKKAAYRFPSTAFLFTLPLTITFRDRIAAAAVVATWHR